MIWGWLIVYFFTIICGFTMAEICSVYPLAGSVYNWSGMLASKKWAPFVCYITGWFNFLGNDACEASFAYGFASLIAAADSLR